MDIGIGLPATIPGTRGSLILDWAERADSGPFSSLGIIDRLVYPNYEPLITLAAAAAVTDRVRHCSASLRSPGGPKGGRSAADDMAGSIPSSRGAVEGLIRGFGEVGADEVVCWPTVAELDQVDRLADLVG